MLSLIQLISLLILASSSHGFVLQPRRGPSGSLSSTATTTPQQLTDLPAFGSMYDTPSECFIIYPDDESDEQELRYVCTNEPEEYAWFNGLKVEELVPTNAGTPLNALQCLETESFRGIPEWECRLSP